MQDAEMFGGEKVPENGAVRRRDGTGGIGGELSRVMVWC